MDDNEGRVNHLLHYVWRQGNDGDDKVFPGAVEDFFGRVDRFPSCTSLALVHLLLSRVGGAVMCAQVVDNSSRAVGGPVGS